jgi:hypothetical protein
MRATLLNELVLFAAVGPAALWAADVWEAKPFQNWTQKDVQKIFNNSPWARQARAVIAIEIPQATGRIGQPAFGDTSSNDSGAPKGREPEGAGRLGGAPGEVDQGPQSQVAVPVIVRWQSALPLRQAQMLGRYGDNVAISPEAQKFLTHEPGIYVVAISGLEGSIVSAGGGDQAKQSIAEKSTLTVRGKPPLRPIAVDFLPVGSTVDVLIAFPRSARIALEDQEVEVASEIGRATVRYKFKLKDMVLRGKLEL